VTRNWNHDLLAMFLFVMESKREDEIAEAKNEMDKPIVSIGEHATVEDLRSIASTAADSLSFMTGFYGDMAGGKVYTVQQVIRMRKGGDKKVRKALRNLVNLGMIGMRRKMGYPPKLDTPASSSQGVLDKALEAAPVQPTAFNYGNNIQEVSSTIELGGESFPVKIPSVLKTDKIPRFSVQFMAVPYDSFLLNSMYRYSEQTGKHLESAVAEEERSELRFFKEGLERAAEKFQAVAENYRLSNGSYPEMLARLEQERSVRRRMVAHSPGSNLFSPEPDPLYMQNWFNYCLARWQITDPGYNVRWLATDDVVETLRMATEEDCPQIYRINRNSDAGIFMRGGKRGDTFPSDLASANVMMAYLTANGSRVMRDLFPTLWLAEMKPKLEAYGVAKNVRLIKVVNAFGMVPAHMMLAGLHTGGRQPPWSESNIVLNGFSPFKGGLHDLMMRMVLDKNLKRFRMAVYSDNLYVYDALLDSWYSYDGEKMESCVTPNVCRVTMAFALTKVFGTELDFTGLCRKDWSMEEFLKFPMPSVCAKKGGAMRPNPSWLNYAFGLYPEIATQAHLLLRSHQFEGAGQLTGINGTFENNTVAMLDVSRHVETEINGHEDDLGFKIDDLIPEIAARVGVSLKLEMKTEHFAARLVGEANVFDRIPLDLLGFDLVKFEFSDLIPGREGHAFLPVLNEDRFWRALVFNKVTARDKGELKGLSRLIRLVKLRTLYFVSGWQQPAVAEWLKWFMQEQFLESGFAKLRETTAGLVVMDTLGDLALSSATGIAADLTRELADSSMFEQMPSWINMMFNRVVPTFMEVLQLSMPQEEFVNLVRDYVDFGLSEEMDPDVMAQVVTPELVQWALSGVDVPRVTRLARNLEMANQSLGITAEPVDDDVGVGELLGNWKGPKIDTSNVDELEEWDRQRRESEEKQYSKRSIAGMNIMVRKRYETSSIISQDNKLSAIKELKEYIDNNTFKEERGIKFFKVPINEQKYEWVRNEWQVTVDKNPSEMRPLFFRALERGLCDVLGLSLSVVQAAWREEYKHNVRFWNPVLVFQSGSSYELFEMPPGKIWLEEHADFVEGVATRKGERGYDYLKRVYHEYQLEQAVLRAATRQRSKSVPRRRPDTGKGKGKRSKKMGRRHKGAEIFEEEYEDSD